MTYMIFDFKKAHNDLFCTNILDFVALIFINLKTKQYKKIKLDAPFWWV